MHDVAAILATERAAAIAAIAGGSPVVLRRLADDWPIVRAARESRFGWMHQIAANAHNHQVRVLLAAPEIEGRFHYGPDGRSMNFARGEVPLPTVLKAIEDEADAPNPRAIAVQGLSAIDFVPIFPAAHPMPVVPDSAKPRLWISNASKVATHCDPTDNVAVVAAGRRRFTLFPPSAAADLYMGPTEPTPAGTPISMVHVTAPDLIRYPRYAQAAAIGQEAELEPGDAIFIPANWFHHVESLAPANLLVNYWWAP